LVLDVPDLNFYREVTLEVSNDLDEWRSIQSGAAIYSYNPPKFVGKDTGLAYSETTSRYLRIVIHDEDSPPLSIQNVKVWGLRRRLVFTASPNRSYQLYYGNPEAQRPSYDIERVFPYLVTDELPQTTLGPQTLNSGFVEKVPPPTPPPPFSERFPWLLPTVLAVVGGLAALLLVGMARRMRKALPPSDE
jgi:hypothetical protein